ncbi:shikimate dehydrogenase family protein [Aspergillus ibericus CBS 121593]|uniref:Shikimate n=1 Tax=Aspergillus ibericus CBS 121593 TaxID=1448316 RepID=A0A395H893_9EURO|nr:shikimate [Aspergillus ibericus CBS 121593]RAL04127.1 shikimate [Aspergillus ibericus CBS 121593]
MGLGGFYMLVSSCLTLLGKGASDSEPPKYAYLVGVGVTHSIAPPMHNYSFHAINYDWTFIAQECPTIEDAMALFRQPTFAGGVVTMPYKRTIMDHLDGLDEYATRLQACNNVYRAADGSLRGTNTDWRGIEGCLLGASEEGRNRPAVIVGAGGGRVLGCSPIYVVNRDREEVGALVEDVAKEYRTLEMVHVERAEEVTDLSVPFYIVGTVPDAAPSTPAEVEVHRIVDTFLSNPTKGVLLDMCFKPRKTRFLQAAQNHGWTTVEGTEVIGHQMLEQYRLWCGEEASRKIPVEGAWSLLRQGAQDSPAINF